MGGITVNPAVIPSLQRGNQRVMQIEDIGHREVQPLGTGGRYDMRGIPHWMPWQERLGWVTLRIMSIHHMDTFRYWFGNPERIFASVRTDPRTQFEHTDGIASYILEYENGLRAIAIGGDGSDDDDLGAMAEALEKALGQQQAATMWFMQNAMQNPNHLGAGAHHYMHIMGIVTLGWMWLRMAKVAQTALASDTDDKAFYEAKLATARYYMDRFLPDVGALRRKLEAGADSLMALDEAAFSTAA